MTLRWRKRYPDYLKDDRFDSALYQNKTVCLAVVDKLTPFVLSGSWVKGWYFEIPRDNLLKVPYTCSRQYPVSTEEAAKQQAMAYVKQFIK